MPMKRLLLSLAALAAPFALFLAICEYRLAQVPANQIAAKKRLFAPKRRDAEVLILGSSHAYFGILPEELGEKAFNLSGLSQSLYYDRGLVEACLGTMPALKTVILPVSYHSLEMQLDETVERWRAYYYRYEWGLPHRDWHMACHVRNFSAYFLEGRTIGPRKVFLGKIRNVERDFDPAGGWTNRVSLSGLPDEAFDADLETDAPIALKRHHSYMNPKNLPENERLVEKLAQELSGRGIQLAMVTLPVSQYYARGIDPAAYQRMQSTLHRLCQSRCLNYLVDPRFTDADFCNADHLNLEGAKKFTRLLKADLASPPRPAPDLRASR